MYWILMLVLIAADQISKYFVASYLPYGEAVPVIPGILQLFYIHNEGAAFSILQGKQWFFILVSLVVLAVVIALLIRMPKAKKWWRLSLTFFLAGTIGNFIDRLRFGYVVDFLDIFIIPIFNVADCLLVVSVLAICILLLFDEKTGREVKHDRH